MPAQDYVTSRERHDAAVADLAAQLRAAGLHEHSGPPFKLPPYTFAVSPRRGINPRAGVVPRDLVVRLSGGPISLKVYGTNGGTTHSSLFRSYAYAVMAPPGEAYVQVVQGGRDIPIQWLEGLQDPLDLSNPAGIHGMSAFIAAVAAAVSRQSNEAGGADHDG